MPPARALAIAIHGLEAPCYLTNMTDTIITYIKKEILNDPNTALTVQDDLLGGGLVDSMGFVRIISFLEEEYDITIPPTDMIIEHFVNIEAMSNYIVSRQTVDDRRKGKHEHT